MEKNKSLLNINIILNTYYSEKGKTNTFLSNLVLCRLASTSLWRTFCLSFLIRLLKYYVSPFTKWDLKKTKKWMRFFSFCCSSFLSPILHFQIFYHSPAFQCCAFEWRMFKHRKERVSGGTTYFILIFYPHEFIANFYTVTRCNCTYVDAVYPAKDFTIPPIRSD